VTLPRSGLGRKISGAPHSPLRYLVIYSPILSDTPPYPSSFSITSFLVAGPTYLVPWVGRLSVISTGQSLTHLITRSALPPTSTWYRYIQNEMKDHQLPTTRTSRSQPTGLLPYDQTRCHHIIAHASSFPSLFVTPNHYVFSPHLPGCHEASRRRAASGPDPQTDFPANTLEMPLL
jgi:hypothetical protein